MRHPTISSRYPRVINMSQRTNSSRPRGNLSKIHRPSPRKTSRSKKLMNDIAATSTEITTEQFEFAQRSLESLPFSLLIGMRLVDLKMDEATIAIEMRDDLRQP